MNMPKNKVMDDADEFPNIVLPSPKSRTSKFHMPDASVVAAQRKEALEQDVLIATYKRECKEDLPSSQNSDIEIATCLNELKLERRSNFLQSENPGIILAEVDLDVFCSGLPEREGTFARSTLTKLLDLEKCKLQLALDLLLDMIEMAISEEPLINYESLLCQLLMLSSIVLDRKCRMLVDKFKATKLVQQLLSGILQEHHGMAMIFAQDLSQRFTHFHDRLYMCENIFIVEKFKYGEFSFAARIAQNLAFVALCELIGCRSRYSESVPQTVFEIKQLLYANKQGKSLQPYEQFGLFKLLNVLFEFLPNEYESKEERTGVCEAKKKIISYVSSRNRNEVTSSGDTEQLKVMIARTKLLWEVADVEYPERQ